MHAHDEINNVTSDTKHAEWLGDTGAQCHVRSAEKDETGSSASSVRMGNNSTSKVLKHETTVLKDELGTTLILRNTRVVSNLATNAISLLQLMD